MDGLVCWSHIHETFHTNSGIQLSLILKVTKFHIHLPPFGEKMKLKFTQQVFNHTMSATMETFIERDVLPKFEIPTQLFCKNVNDLFDILNETL